MASGGFFHPAEVRRYSTIRSNPCNRKMSADDSPHAQQPPSAPGSAGGMVRSNVNRFAPPIAASQRRHSSLRSMKFRTRTRT